VIFMDSMISRRQAIALGVAGLAGLPTVCAAQAGSWQPSKPIRIVAGQAPGASTDATARALADYFSQKFGVPVTVENKPGGVGMIAGESVASAPADGHTLLVTLQSQMAQAPALLKKPSINPDKDLVPIGAFGVGPVVGVLHKDFPAKTLDEVIAMAKRKPVNVGNYAIGSGWQMMLNQLAKDTGAQFSVLNYKGTGAMLADLFAGHIDMGAGSLAGMAGGLQKGLVKPVVIAIGERSSKLPGVPTWVDAGFKGPAYEDLAEMNMLLAPAGTPQNVIDTLAAMVSASISESPRMKTVRDTLGAEDTPLVGAQLRQFIGRSWPTYRRMSREMGLAAD
jgi:tripartite-type tricarboxylate transporter receptor subunit TctC